MILTSTEWVLQPDGQFHHVAVVVNGDSETVYVDGVRTIL